MNNNTCRLWIDAPGTVEAIQAALVAGIEDRFTGLGIACDLDRNGGFDPGGKDGTDFIASSPWTAWLETACTDRPAVEAFQAGVCSLIASLRRQGFSVTAACDFEDRVIAATGWNWTSDQPLPPR